MAGSPENRVGGRKVQKTEWEAGSPENRVGGRKVQKTEWEAGSPENRVGGRKVQKTEWKAVNEFSRKRVYGPIPNFADENNISKLDYIHVHTHVGP